MINYFIGVDPGANGGLAIIFLSKSKDITFVTARSMPTVKIDDKPSLDTRALENFFPHQPFIAVLEYVSAMPKQGVSSMFQFGRMFGAIEAMLDATAEEIIYVRPRKWKKYFDISADKEEAIRYADTRFGMKEPWHRSGRNGGKLLERNSGNAEAALLGLYGALNYEN